MRWNEIKNEPCSIARTLSVIGDRWTILIIRNAFLGIRRFDDFQAQLDVTRHLLTDRLGQLVAEDILYKAPYQEKPVRYEYKLTSKGKELYPVLMTLVSWGDKWMVTEAGVPLEYLDRRTGRPIDPILVDGNTGEPIKANRVTFRPGPGLEKIARDPAFLERWGHVMPEGFLDRDSDE